MLWTSDFILKATVFYWRVLSPGMIWSISFLSDYEHAQASASPSMKFTLTLPLSLAVALFVGRVVDMHCRHFLTIHSSHSVLASAPTVSSEMLHQVHQWAPYFKTFKGHFLPFYWTTLLHLAMEMTLLFENFSAFGTCGSLHHLSWPPRAPPSQIGWPNGTPWVQGVSFTLFNWS